MTLCSSNFCRFFWVYFEMNFITNQLINIERLPIATFKNMVFAPIFPEFQLAEYSVGWPKLSAPNIRPIWPKFSAEYSVSVVHYINILVSVAYFGKKAKCILKISVRPKPNIRPKVSARSAEYSAPKVSANLPNIRPTNMPGK